jgi:tetratricopeptide (TPR) repeat protein
MNRRERRAAGKTPRTATRKIAGPDPAALYEAGIAHLRAGKMLDAQVCGQQALMADPAHADSLHLMSLITIDAQHFDLAAEWARRAVAQDPKPQYLFTLGSVLRQQKQFEEALEAIEQALRLEPDAVELWRLLADVMVDLNRTDRAIGCARAWEERLGPHDRLRVGLVWSDNPDHENDHNRSVPLGILSELFDLDATFVSLQKDPSADDRALLSHSEVIDLTAELTDFSQTAALMSCLDLVISVDSSVAHLAGAMGRPVWTLLPHTADYRWLLDRDDSPSYPTMRLFRQDARRSYAEVIARVRGELEAMIETRG